MDGIKRPHLSSPRKKLFCVSALVLTFVLYSPAELFAEEAMPLPNSDAKQEVAAPALSGTLYISDDLKTALRTGATTNHRISAFLPSGTPLSVKQSTNEWVEVDVIGTNKTGWISRLSVQQQPGAKARLVNRDAQIKKLKSELTALNGDHANLGQTKNETQKNLDSVTDQFNRLSKEYDELHALSKDAVKNHQKMQTMHQDMASLQTQYSELEIAHELLRQDNYNRGMVHGLLAVILGIFIAIIVPRLKSRPKSNRW